MAKIGESSAWKMPRYRYHQKYYLQPIDWLLLILGIIVIFWAIFYLLRPKPSPRGKKGGATVIVQQQQQQQSYGTMEPEVVTETVVVVEESGVPEELVEEVVEVYEDKIERLRDERDYLEDVVYDQEEDIIDAYNVGREHQLDRDTAEVEDLLEDAYAKGLEDGVEATCREYLEEEYCSALHVDHGVDLLEQQLQEVAMEKERVMLQRRKLEVAEANNLALKHQKESDSMKLALLERERNLAELEAQRNAGGVTTADSIKVTVQINAQQEAYESYQSSYYSALQEQRLLEERQREANSAFLAEQERAAAALVAEQRRQEEEQAARLMRYERDRMEEEARQQRLEMERLVKMREETLRIQEEKEHAYKQLEAYSAELAAREASVAAKERDAQAILESAKERDALTLAQQIRMEEEAKRNRDAIAREHHLMEARLAEDMRMRDATMKSSAPAYGYGDEGYSVRVTSKTTSQQHKRSY